jgi:outer membrane scaffolding protein for murein synthesis (MipA/OmpV family)
MLVGKVQASERPLWEAGLGIGALATSDYRGADTSSSYVLPYPYLVYRGRFLRADRDGLRGTFFKRDRMELNLSLNATTPVRSRSKGTRVGMPTLPATLEIGPSLQLLLWQSQQAVSKLSLRLPVRTVFTIEASPKSAGWFIAPNFNLDLAALGTSKQWKLGLVLGPLFADRRYHQFFYGVEPPYVTTVRPAYRARSGYSGSQLLISFSRRFPKYWIGGYARHDWLNGVAFSDSPLLRRNSSWSAGFAVARIIGQSSRTVETGEYD